MISRNAGSRVHRAITAIFLAVMVAWSPVPVLGAAKDVANWDFEDQDLQVDMLDPSVPDASLSAGPGLSSLTWETGNAPLAAWAPEYAAWSTAGYGADDYLELAIDMSHIGGIILRFDERRSATGPTDYEIRYAVNGGAFTPLSGGAGTTGDFGTSPMHTHTVAPGSADDLAMRGQANVRFRLFGCNSGGNGGKWRVDNVSISATTSPTAIALGTISAAAVAPGGHAPLPIAAGGVVLLTTYALRIRSRRTSHVFRTQTARSLHIPGRWRRLH